MRRDAKKVVKKVVKKDASKALDEEKNRIIANMLQKDMTPEEIADLCGCLTKEVMAVKAYNKLSEKN